MKPSWVKFLKDPLDGSNLKLHNTKIIKGRVVNGLLKSTSGNIYKIKSGIPILLVPNGQSPKSVESFAYEWNEWGYLFGKKNWFENNINPLVQSESFFKNKLIIDAGAGSGSQTRWMAELGARFIISLELSDTIFDRHKKTIKGFEDIIFPVQCDISNPPIKCSPDLLYCVNVIQHTKSPKDTFKKLVELLDINTLFFFNVYHKESFLGSKIVTILRMFIRYLPFSVWKWFSYVIAKIIFLLNIYSPSIFKRYFENVHFSDNFEELWVQIYDAFGSHYYQSPLSKKEQLTLFKQNNLKILKQNYFGYLLAIQK